MREKDRQLYMAKKRAYSASPSITSGDQCRASLPGLALLLSMGAASHRPHARSFRPKATQAIGPNPVPTMAAWESLKMAIFIVPLLLLFNHTVLTLIRV